MKGLFFKNSLLFFLALLTTPVSAEYQIYGTNGEVDYLLIPKTHIWRDKPRIWTVKKYLDYKSKFSLVYALQEADCERNKIRYRSQTWVLRDDIEGEELLIDSNTKGWRKPQTELFEDVLHIFLCTYVREKESD